jgi:hypothetical protein
MVGAPAVGNRGVKLMGEAAFFVNERAVRDRAPIGPG